MPISRSERRTSRLPVLIIVCVSVLSLTAFGYLLYSLVGDSSSLSSRCFRCEERDKSSEKTWEGSRYNISLQLSFDGSRRRDGGLTRYPELRTSSFSLYCNGSLRNDTSIQTDSLHSVKEPQRSHSPFEDFVSTAVFSQVGKIAHVCSSSDEDTEGNSRAPFFASAASVQRLDAAETGHYTLGLDHAYESVTPAFDFAAYDDLLRQNAGEEGREKAVRDALAGGKVRGGLVREKLYLGNVCIINATRFAMTEVRKQELKSGTATDRSLRQPCSFPVLSFPFSGERRRPRMLDSEDEEGRGAFSLRGVCAQTRTERESVKSIWKNGVQKVLGAIPFPSAKAPLRESWKQSFLYVGRACFIHLPSAPVSPKHGHETKDKLVVYASREALLSPDLYNSGYSPGSNANSSWFCIRMSHSSFGSGEGVFETDCPLQVELEDLSKAQLNENSFFYHTAILLPQSNLKQETHGKASKDERTASLFSAISASLFSLAEEDGSSFNAQESSALFGASVPFDSSKWKAKALFPSSLASSISPFLKDAALSPSEVVEISKGQWYCSRHLFYPLRVSFASKDVKSTSDGRRHFPPNSEATETLEDNIRATSTSKNDQFMSGGSGSDGAFPFDFDVARLMLDGGSLSTTHLPSKTEEKTFITLAPCTNAALASEIRWFVRKFIQEHRLSLRFSEPPLHSPAIAVDLYRHSQAIIVCPATPISSLFYLSPMETDIAVLSLHRSTDSGSETVSPTFFSLASSLKVYLLSFTEEKNVGGVIEAALNVEIFGVVADQCEILS